MGVHCEIILASACRWCERWHRVDSSNLPFHGTSKNGYYYEESRRGDGGKSIFPLVWFSQWNLIPQLLYMFIHCAHTYAPFGSFPLKIFGVINLFWASNLCQKLNPGLFWRAHNDVWLKAKWWHTHNHPRMDTKQRQYIRSIIIITINVRCVSTRVNEPKTKQ